MPLFTNNESYKHKCAKEIFKQWCDSTSWSYGDARRVSTNYNRELYWRSNRSQEAWLEYPIVVNSDINSIENNWDEIWPGLEGGMDLFCNGFVPTYTECNEYNLYPISVADIVLPHKGSPSYFIEICHTNSVSNEKLEKLKQVMTHNASLIEIDAEWILRQTGIPSKLEIKRWLI